MLSSANTHSYARTYTPLKQVFKNRLLCNYSNKIGENNIIEQYINTLEPQNITASGAETFYLFGGNHLKLYEEVSFLFAWIVNAN